MQGLSIRQQKVTKYLRKYTILRYLVTKKFQNLVTRRLTKFLRGRLLLNEQSVLSGRWSIERKN